MISDLGTATDFQREARVGPGAPGGFPEPLAAGCPGSGQTWPGEGAVAWSTHPAPRRATPLRRCGRRPRGRLSWALAPRWHLRPGALAGETSRRARGGGCATAALRFAQRGGPCTRRGDSRRPPCPLERVAQPSAWGQLRGFLLPPTGCATGWGGQRPPEGPGLRQPRPGLAHPLTRAAPRRKQITCGRRRAALSSAGDRGHSLWGDAA